MAVGPTIRVPGAMFHFHLPPSDLNVALFSSRVNSHDPDALDAESDAVFSTTWAGECQLKALGHEGLAQVLQLNGKGPQTPLIVFGHDSVRQAGRQPSKYPKMIHIFLDCAVSKGMRVSVCVCVSPPGPRVHHYRRSHFRQLFHHHKQGDQASSD